MLLVVDVNVVFSALMKKGNCFEIFEANKVLKKFELITPEFMALELERKIDKLASKSKLSIEELKDILSSIKTQVTFVASSDFVDKLSEAFELNSKDAPYIALALKFNCPIFSGDKGLKKQAKVKVFSPRELLDMLKE